MAQQPFRQFTPEEQAAIDAARQRATAPAPRQQGRSRLGSLLAEERGEESPVEGSMRDGDLGELHGGGGVDGEGEDAEAGGDDGGEGR